MPLQRHLLGVTRKGVPPKSLFPPVYADFSWFWDNAAFAWAPGGDPKDWARGARGTFQNNMAYVLGRYGLAAISAAGADSIQWEASSDYSLSGDRNFTLIVAAENDSASFSNDGMLCYRSSFGSGMWELYCQSDSNVYFTFHTGGGATGPSWSSAAPSAGDGRLVTYVLTRKVGGTYQLYRSEESGPGEPLVFTDFGTQSDANTIGSGDHVLLIGKLGIGVNFGLEGKYYMAAVLDGYTVNAYQARVLGRNPLAPFLTRPRVIVPGFVGSQAQFARPASDVSAGGWVGVP